MSVIIPYETLVSRHKQVCRDRDAWKFRAEATEAEVKNLEHDIEQHVTTVVEHVNEVDRLCGVLLALRASIHACNRNPIPSSKRLEWRDMIDAALQTQKQPAHPKAGRRKG